MTRVVGWTTSSVSVGPERRRIAETRRVSETSDRRVGTGVERHRADGGLAGACKFGKRRALIARHRLPLRRLRRGRLSRGHVWSRAAQGCSGRSIRDSYQLSNRTPAALRRGRRFRPVYWVRLRPSGFGGTGRPAPRVYGATSPHPMQFVDVIARKRDGQALPREAIDLFVDGVVRGHDPRLSGVRAPDGDRPARDDRRRDRLAHRRDGAVGRPHRPVGPAGREGRQAQHRRGGRQGVDRAGAGGGGVRRDGAEDVGPRPGAHRGHARQARVDSRLPRRPHHRRVQADAAGRGHQHHRPDRVAGPRRQDPLRAARRHRHGREHPAHLGVDHEQEAGGGQQRPACST